MANREIGEWLFIGGLWYIRREKGSDKMLGARLPPAFDYTLIRLPSMDMAMYYSRPALRDLSQTRYL